MRHADAAVQAGMPMTADNDAAICCKAPGDQVMDGGYLLHRSSPNIPAGGIKVFLDIA
ncbi:hypothetical protein [Yoonia vestfoldensis]|jgi:hypothetical protein|uniref:Uncharacterized protein n=1 Tax=Yoonia vestfoldensis SKA53 TaxID=314232 RepID=A3V5G5_9RHOB|nr:hypothetical protein [Yoonia vestfoldensis]EAQ06883.1 hypothetical protein SKA53_15086 [Yoonia vestfoldensis SKA53]